MDVEKMRRQAKRATDAAEDLNRAAWLASLTPEHRAIHESPLSFMCPECHTARMKAFGDSWIARCSALTTPEDGKGATDE